MKKLNSNKVLKMFEKAMAKEYKQYSYAQIAASMFLYKGDTPSTWDISKSYQLDFDYNHNQFDKEGTLSYLHAAGLLESDSEATELVEYGNTLATESVNAVFEEVLEYSARNIYIEELAIVIGDLLVSNEIDVGYVNDVLLTANANATDKELKSLNTYTKASDLDYKSKYSFVADPTLFESVSIMDMYTKATNYLAESNKY